MQRFNKKSFAAYYGISPYLFEQLIDDIKHEIKWKKGKQVFTPKQALRVIEFLGNPK